LSENQREAKSHSLIVPSQLELKGVTLSLSHGSSWKIAARRLAANVAKLPELVRKP
jgi:hypothetical protein